MRFDVYVEVKGSRATFLPPSPDTSSATTEPQGAGRGRRRRGVLSNIVLTEEATTSSARIFIKILFQELSEAMGLAALNARLQDQLAAPWVAGVFPKVTCDSPPTPPLGTATPAASHRRAAAPASCLGSERQPSGLRPADCGAYRASGRTSPPRGRCLRAPRVAHRHAVLAGPGAAAAAGLCYGAPVSSPSPGRVASLRHSVPPPGEHRLHGLGF